MSFELLLRDGSVVNLRDYARKIGYEGRRHTYATTQGRLVEGKRWGVFGDRQELPGRQAIRLYLKTGTTRAWQRSTIETLAAALRETTVLRVQPDLREYLVHGGEIDNEVPAGGSYVLEISFPMAEPEGRFLAGFPLGALRITRYNADGTATVVPLDGVYTEAGSFTLRDDQGGTYEFDTLGAAYV